MLVDNFVRIIEEEGGDVGVLCGRKNGVCLSGIDKVAAIGRMAGRNA